MNHWKPHFIDEQGKPRTQSLRIVVVQAGGLTRLALTLPTNEDPGEYSDGSQNKPGQGNRFLNDDHGFRSRRAFKFTQELKKHSSAGIVMLNGDGLLITTPETGSQSTAVCAAQSVLLKLFDQNDLSRRRKNLSVAFPENDDT